MAKLNLEVPLYPPVLSHCSKGGIVLIWQYFLYFLLKQQKIYQGQLARVTCDGFYTADWFKLVKAWQFESELPITGHFDQATQVLVAQRYNLDVQKVPFAVFQGDFAKTVNPLLQVILCATGFGEGVTISQEFDQATQAALTQFQSAVLYVEPTGFICRSTLRSMFARFGLDELNIAGCQERTLYFDPVTWQSRHWPPLLD